MNYLKASMIGLIALLFVGCWSSEKTNSTVKEDMNADSVNASNSQQNEKPDVNANQTLPNGDTTEETARIETYDPPENKELTPTETLKAYNLASVNKNPDKIKNLISKGSVHLITQKAKEAGLSFNQAITEGEGTPAFETTEISNEKISDNTASVDIKFADREKIDTVPFIKEDGEWKIDFVKFFKDVITETNS